jgi:hypothetical protein
MSQDEAFKAWWYSEGSQPPYTHHDCEEHTMRMCEIAWANGAYKAIAELESQEPVAVKRMKEWVEFLKRQSDNGQHMNIPSGLSAGTCWEIAIELEQFINTTPPQRTEQEPVAWMHTKIDGVAVPHRPADLDKHPERWEALYKTPPPCPTCEALARTVMLDQTSHD